MPDRAVPLCDRARASSLICGLGLWWLSACTGATSPQATTSAYARALADERFADAYSLLSRVERQNLSLEEFVRLARRNSAEIRELAVALEEASATPEVRTTLPLSDGRQLLLVLENGRWKVDGSALEVYPQHAPRAALLSFVRAYDRGRFDVLLRFVPDKDLIGLDEKKLEVSWRGELKTDMDGTVEALRIAAPEMPIEILGDRAAMGYGSVGTVELVLEHGVWKIQDFR